MNRKRLTGLLHFLAIAILGAVCIWISLYSGHSGIAGLIPLSIVLGCAVLRKGFLLDSLLSENQKLREAGILLKENSQLDPLTRVLNRSCFSELVERELSGGRSGVLIFLDADRFKSVNDNYGHAVGDLLLCTIANAMRCCFRTSDLLCRLGGDEFLVWMSGSVSDHVVETRLARLEHQIAAVAEDGMPVCTVSAGYARSHPNDNFVLLCDRADRQMYRQKQTVEARHT